MRRIKAASVYLASMICVIALCGHAHGEIVIGKPHTCERGESANAGVMGITTLTFRITKEGRVASPTVTSSSGSAEQDAEALHCVQFWRYRPTVRDGEPVETPWIADIAWNPTGSVYLRKEIGECAKGLRARIRDFTIADGVTELAITYGHFKVTAVVVTHSSGDPALDKAATDCIMSEVPPRETVVVTSKPGNYEPNTYPVKIVWKMTDE